MRFSSFLSSALLLIGSAVEGYCQSDCIDASIIAHTGTPEGSTIVHDGLTIYVAEPGKKNKRAKARKGAAVLFLSDVFGLSIPESKLLADSYARAGYLTIIPDLFDGNPAPEDLNDPNFNTTEFFMLHNPSTIDPKIAKAINYLRVNKNISKIGAPGYCFGGRYSFRFAGASGVASGPSNAFIDAAFAAHPSLLEDEEIEAIGAPAAIAAAEDDPLFADAARLNAEVLLRGTNQPYRTTLYSGTHHGFGVRVDLSDDEQREGKEDAFLQAVAWFDRYLI